MQYREQNSCNRTGMLPSSLPLAMAYVPIQKFGETFPPEVAIVKGTLFPDLDKPFLGRTIGGCRRG